MKRPIVTAPEAALRKIAEKVPFEEIASSRIQRLISDMKDTLAASPDGVGLAAPQIGALLRIFLVSEEAEWIDARRAAPEDGARPQFKQYVFINPVATKRARKKIDMPEGCLSVPQRFGLVPRAEKIALEWLDETGKKHSRGFTKFFARVVQHELDHLDGALILDRMKKSRRAERP